MVFSFNKDVSPEKFNKIWGKIIARSWSDSTFRQRVRDDPGEVLKENGVEIPDNVIISVDWEGSASNKGVIVLPFPEKPADISSSDPRPEEGTYCCCTIACCCC